MSSITRIMMGLPQLPTDKVRTKKIGDIIFTRVIKPNGDKELSIIKDAPEGRKLLKSVFENEKGSNVYKPGKYHKYYEKKSGNIYDVYI